LKVQLPDGVRASIGKFYLDWAEKLPKFGGGIIEELQSHRADDRRKSEESHKRSRPPDGIALDILFFRLIEVFHLEDFDKLQVGLKRLFPTLDEQFLTPKFTERFKKRAEAIGGGWHWPNLGYIYRDPNERLLGPAYWRIMPNLPSEIQFITVGLLQLLPSLIIVSIDVHLNDEAVRKVKKLQDTKYLPTVLFANLLPWKLWRGYTGNFPEIEMRKAILDWFDELRGRTEKGVASFLKRRILERLKRTNSFTGRRGFCG
jgi:hypothetical protein